MQCCTPVLSAEPSDSITRLNKIARTHHMRIAGCYEAEAEHKRLAVQLEIGGNHEGALLETRRAREAREEAMRHNALYENCVRLREAIIRARQQQEEVSSYSAASTTLQELLRGQPEELDEIMDTLREGVHSVREGEKELSRPIVKRVGMKEEKEAKEELDGLFHSNSLSSPSPPLLPSIQNTSSPAKLRVDMSN